MPHHPKQVHWFEAELPRDQSVLALETLVSTRSVQLEEEGYCASPGVNIERLQKYLAKCDQLINQYANDLPSDNSQSVKHLGDPETVAESAIETIQQWVGQLLKTKRHIRQTEIETAELGLLGECLAAMGQDSQGLGGFSHSSKLLYKQIFACPQGELEEMGEDKDTLGIVYHGQSRDFLVIVGMPNRKTLFDGAATLLDCTPLSVPQWLPRSPEEQIVAVKTRLDLLSSQKEELITHLEDLRADAEVRVALAKIRLLHWYQRVFFSKTRDNHTCQLNGWTVASTPDEMEAQLASAGIKAKVTFTPPRGDLKPPVSLDSDRWSQPFQLFVKLLGTPGRDEIDPTRLLAVIVPLLFGFMFPDVGHGLILAAAGLVLARKNKAAIILVPCGLSAAGFGVLFGEVFGLHGILPSLWGYPLEHPVEILIVPMLFGIALMLLGLIFSGIEAWWRFELSRWMLEEAPVILLYISTALLLIYPLLWPVSVLGLIWYFLGTGLLCRHTGIGCFLRCIGGLVESSFQLIAGTISFLRVGAFAIAHGAFSTVVLALVDQIEIPVLQGIVFVAGHIFIIIVEGLIVMVQTARLILFEFFMRFLHFEGRIYKPLVRRSE